MRPGTFDPISLEQMDLPLERGFQYCSVGRRNISVGLLVPDITSNWTGRLDKGAGQPGWNCFFTQFLANNFKTIRAT